VHIEFSHSLPTTSSAARLEAVHITPYADRDGNPVLTVSKEVPDGPFRFAYSDGCEFWVDPDGSRIRVNSPPSTALEDVATYLVGPILGFVLRLRGAICLHASAAILRERAVALAGPPGIGKSTAAAALARRGLPVLTDDILALRPKPPTVWALPGYSRLNLWPDSVRALFGKPDHLPPITPTWEKRFLDLRGLGYQFHSEMVRLGAIYVLEGGVDCGRNPTVEAHPFRRSLMSLVANTYANHLLDRGARGREFAELGAVVENVPVRCVRFSADPESRAGIPEAVIADFESLSRSAGQFAREA